MRALTEDDLSIFRAFGFLALRPGEFECQMAAIGAECRAALVAAYGSPVRQLELAKRSLCYLPMMGAEAACSLALVQEDLLVSSASRLLDAEPIVKPAKVSLFAASSSWHRDCYTGLRGVKWIAYLGARPVALDVVPGSHLPAAESVVSKLLGSDRSLPWQRGNIDRLRAAGVPVHRVELQPELRSSSVYLGTHGGEGAGQSVGEGLKPPSGIGTRHVGYPLR